MIPTFEKSLFHEIPGWYHFILMGYQVLQSAIVKYDNDHDDDEDDELFFLVKLLTKTRQFYLSFDFQDF